MLVEPLTVIFPRFSGHTKAFQLITKEMEVCHG